MGILDGLIAAQGAIDVEAQADTLTLAAKDQLKLVSANLHVDFAAAKSITLAVAGGASLTIEGGNITFACPGTITVHAGMKTFAGPTQMSYPLPMMPKTICMDCLQKARQNGSRIALT